MNKKRELPYFNIGKSYGGNQRWMIDPWMHIGGCAALTTCDILIYMASHLGRSDLYTMDVNNLSRKDYVKFAMSVKLYLQPRESGIKDIDTYMNGVRQYFEDTDVTDIDVRGIAGDEDYSRVEMAIMNSIDNKMPVAYLMLKHRDKEFNFFEWHWFIVNGYEIKDDGLYIKVATYGANHWLNLKKLWDTGMDEKGGIVLYERK